MPRDDPDALLTVAQAASLLGVHPNTIRTWTDGGRLAAYRINARGDRRFRRADVERILVEDAPAADHHARSNDHRQRDAELAFFERVAGGLTASPTPGTVARALVEALRTELHVGRAAVYLLAGDQLELVAHAGFDAPPPFVRTVPGDGREGHADDDDHEIVLSTRRGRIGSIVLDAASAERMGPSLMRAMASTMAPTLASSRVIVRARRELRRARALRSVIKELTGTLDLGSLLGDVVERTRSLFEADKAGLWLIDERDRMFRAAAHQGLGDEFLARVEALTVDADTIGARAMRDRRAYWIGDAPIEAVGVMRDAYAAEGVRTACLVPLVSGDQALGLLGL